MMAAVHEDPRNFSTVLHDICNALPKEQAERLRNDAQYWAPEIMWYNLNCFVQMVVKPDSKNPKAIEVYAILSGASAEEIKTHLVSLGL